MIGYLDTFVEQVEAAQFATLVYAEIDPDTGTVTLAAAGHPPPVAGHAGRGPSCSWAGARRRWAFTRRVPRAEATLRARARATGLSSTPTASSSAAGEHRRGLERLLAVAYRPDAPEELARALEEDGRGDDDVCVLVFRRRMPSR